MALALFFSATAPSTGKKPTLFYALKEKKPMKKKLMGVD